MRRRTCCRYRASVDLAFPCDWQGQLDSESCGCQFLNKAETTVKAYGLCEGPAITLD